MSSSEQIAERIEKFKRVFDLAWVPRDIYTGTDLITVEWPHDLSELCDVHVILRHESGRHYAEASVMLGPETTTVTLGKALNAPDGRYEAVIRPKAMEYYNGANYERCIAFYVVHDTPTRTHYGDLASRRMETLQQAARRGPDVYSELARQALGQAVREKALLDAIQTDDPNLDAILGLLFMIGRYGDQLPVALLATLNGQLRRVDYSRFDVYPITIACRALDSVLYKRNQAQAMNTARHWLQSWVADGFDFSKPIDDVLMVLATVVELADDVAELAAVVLDKLLYTVALYPSAPGFDARISPLSPVTRLLWGIGNYNQHIAAATLLACAERYEVPSLIQAIAITAANSDEPLFARDAHRYDVSPHYDKPGHLTNLRTIYRTPDYSLVSFKSNGWLAEMGHVRVFNINKHEYALSHYKNILGVRGGEGTWHVYWPTYAFDKWTLRDGWAFARVGMAYIAIHGGEGMQLLDTGISRGRELHTEGGARDWQCRMGCASEDGSFEDFIETILAAPPSEIMPEPLPENRHYESIYCTVDFDEPTMDIRYLDYLMRLDFSGADEG